MNKFFKQISQYIIPVLLFLFITAIYFVPVIQGKDLSQMDNTHAIGMAQELNNFKNQTGEESMWTNSMFGGMPAYQIKGGTPMNIYHYLSVFLRFGLPSNTMAIVFLYFLGFFILMLTLKFEPWQAFLGATAFAFSSYNFIIILAGHLTKAYAIAYMAPVLAGVILLFNGNLRWGLLLTTIALGIEIAVNHVQMTYYLMIIILVLMLVYYAMFAVEHVKKQNANTSVVKLIAFAIIGFFYAIYDFFKFKSKNNPLVPSVYLAVAVVLAVVPNITNLWTTYEYGKESIRGKTELTAKTTEKISEGLDKDYALGWSYGKSETFTLLIPRFNGGASHGELDESSKTYQVVAEKYGQENAEQIAKSLPTYWGEMPFTSGPVYVGAIICFLFVLGLFIVKGPAKWWLLIATLLSIFLAWGKNWMWFTDLFFYYFPMYSKFRSVSSILVIAGLTIPILAMLALKEIFSAANDKKKMQQYLKISFYIVGGICLFFAVLPGAFYNFTSSSDKMLREQGIPEFLMAALIDDREAMLRTDAFRSFVFIGITFVLLWFYLKEKFGVKMVVWGLIVAVLLDMVWIAKKYLNNDHFISKMEKRMEFTPTAADLEILKDKDPNFRVFNVTINPFNEVNTSYFHKSIGGYHGAKLRRYQDLIERHISKNNMQVLNMLNTKYFIVNDETTKKPVARLNRGALGNAWFVEKVQWVNNADEEIDALTNFNPAQTAVIDKRFKQLVKDTAFIADTTDFIKLDVYKPNALTYSYNATHERLVVFSEIYYDKGWNAYIDDVLTPHFRANYVLRAMVVPAGKHTITFKFEPKSYYNGQRIALISSIIVALVCIGIVFLELRKRGMVSKKA